MREYHTKLIVNCRSLVSELQIKLESSQNTVRRLSRLIGTTMVSSSNDNSDDSDLSSKSHEVEQRDNEFGAEYTYTTNVCLVKCLNNRILYTL